MIKIMWKIILFFCDKPRPGKRWCGFDVLDGLFIFFAITVVL